MVEFEVKNYDGQIYLKEELKKVLNTPTLKVVAGDDAILLFAEKASLGKVRKSLKVILKIIENRIEAEEEL